MIASVPTTRPSAPPGARRLARLGRSPRARLVVTAALGALGLALSILAARRFAGTPLPLTRGQPALLAAAGLLFAAASALKIGAWQRLFTVDERPGAVSLAAATGGASIVGLAVPARCADVVRIAIVRRGPNCPAGVRTLCLSLVMLGLIDGAALAPLALGSAFLPGASNPVRAALILLAGVGVAAAAVVVVLPRVATSGRLARSRLGPWLGPRTTPLRAASGAWALASASLLVRVVALVLLLGALGVGFSFGLAVLYISAGAAAGALPFGPAGASKAAAGAAAIMASGVGASHALDVALAVQALGVLAGVAILLVAAVWQLAANRRRSSGRRHLAGSLAPGRLLAAEPSPG